MGAFFRGECAPEGGDRHMLLDFVGRLFGQLRVGERFDAGLELAQKKIGRKIQALAFCFDQKLTLDFEPDLMVAAGLDNQVRLTGGAVAEDALDAGGLDLLPLGD